MVNKYGNDFKNNIMWNKEYPFIPEVTNNAGFTIHEGDVVEFYDEYDKKYFAARVYKIYNKDFIWTRYYRAHVGKCDLVQPANYFEKHSHNTKPLPYEDFDNQGISNEFESFLTLVYNRIYPEELNLPNDWHFDEKKFDAKRLEEVARIKNKY